MPAQVAIGQFANPFEVYEQQSCGLIIQRGQNSEPGPLMNQTIETGVCVLPIGVCCLNFRVHELIYTEIINKGKGIGSYERSIFVAIVAKQIASTLHWKNKKIDPPTGWLACQPASVITNYMLSESLL